MVEMADGEDGRALAEAAVEWPQGFVDLYRSRWAPMVRLARLLMAGDPAAEEIVQEAFLRVRAQWERIENPSAYARAAVVNACRNHQRRRRLEQRQPGTSVASDDAYFEMRGAIASLPERQRSAVVLRFYEDLPEAEIAALLGCSVPAVKSLLHRAMSDLRKVVER
jgi:RNA polymerase sigma-70 factor (sigma-E family)